MIRLSVVGMKPDLQAVIRAIRTLGVMHIDRLEEFDDLQARPLNVDRRVIRRREEIQHTLSRLEGLLGVFGWAETLPEVEPGDVYRPARKAVDELLPQVKELNERLDKLRAQQDVLPRYANTLRKLVPIMPAEAHVPGNMTIGVLTNLEHKDVLGLVRRQVQEATHGEAVVVSRDVDESTRAMLIVFPQEYAGEIEGLVGKQDLSQLELPADYAGQPPDMAISSISRRLAMLPNEIGQLEHELAELGGEWRARLSAWHAALEDELAELDVLSRLGETEHTFVIAGWVPRPERERFESALLDQFEGRIYLEDLPVTEEVEALTPVKLDNPAPVKPFESLVELLAVPRYDGLDPSWLMTIFLPIFFGMILGDAGYGVVLLLVCLLLMRRLAGGLVRDVVKILVIGSGWSIVFGFLYGEVFGTLGHELGMHAILFDRAAPEYVPAFLILSIAVGAVHILLGLLIGLWQAWRENDRGHLMERGGRLVGLVALFLLAGALADYLPAGFRTPAVAGLIIGLVVMSVPMGWTGLLIGPLEFISLLGNILSYLRIAAIGLASVYLAQVANEMAGVLGSLIVGVIVAVLIHALNIVLGAFSPTIQSMRLHYVEFFQRFYEGGGRRYEPFRRSYAHNVREE